MKKKFAELRKGMSAGSRKRAAAQTQGMLEEMLLAEIRKHVGLTQNQLADKLGIKQPTLSRLESQDDMYVSTLRRLIEALGGKMEIVIHLPGGDIRLQHLEESASA